MVPGKSLCSLSDGALYQMLRNKIYVGEISHRGVGYPGEHEGIIDRDIFDRVGGLLDGNRVDQKHAVRAASPSLLAGVIWDDAGRRMTPNHANKRNGARYRYYISAKDKERLAVPVARIPAGDIENIVTHQLRQHTELTWDGPMPSRELILAAIDRIIISDSNIKLQLHGRADPINIAASLIRRSGEKRIAVAPEDAPGPRKDEALIKLIVRAHQARKALEDPINASVQAAAAQLQLSVQYYCALVRLGHLAPDITAAILDGRQPAHINRQYLARITNLPIDWREQRAMLGFV